MATGLVPKPTPETAPFWEGTKARELRLQQCNDCGKFYFYPRSHCRYCNSENVEWKTVSGKGTLASYVINNRPTPPFDKDTPIIVALIQLEEGPRMMSNIVGVEPKPENLTLDAPVTVDFEERGDQVLPVFRFVSGE
jgi:uncharacterized OB-fold protein